MKATQPNNKQSQRNPVKVIFSALGTQARFEAGARALTSGKVSLEKTMRRHVLPHAPSPTTTSFLRSPMMDSVGGVVNVLRFAFGF